VDDWEYEGVGLRLDLYIYRIPPIRMNFKRLWVYPRLSLNAWCELPIDQICEGQSRAGQLQVEINQKLCKAAFAAKWILKPDNS
jgi:hypothetical protein